jgi:hypothetical protein
MVNACGRKYPTPSLRTPVIETVVELVETVEMSGVWQPTQRVSAEANLFVSAEPQGGRRSQPRN